ncbi:condensation domain-containing protein [Streptomyces sp. NPDC006997]|uniref:condensation domain-containing protein n=1 Tax=Streptomyces sp. NPDC006997 TaxID=3155356 RepID=UPI0033C3F98B
MNGASRSGARSGQLCWGQRYHWLRYQQVPPGTRHDAHVVVNSPVPAGVPLNAVRTAVDFLVRRHEGLRTVIDAEARPWPRQVVHPPRPLRLRTVTSEDDGTPGPAEVIAEMTGTEFDPARDWPIRVCVVTSGGMPARVVLVLHHMSCDDWSLALFRGEFAEVVGALSRGQRAQLPPVAHQPVALAAAEAALAPAERERTAAYWREAVGRLPADMFGSRRRAPTGTAAPVAHAATYTAPALLGTVRQLAARLRLWPAAVHLAAYAVACAAYTGQPGVAYRWLASHREGPMMNVMTCMFSPALVGVDLSGDPVFSEVATRVAEALTSAQDHARTPWDELAELVAREGHHRGRPLRVTSEVNFLSRPEQRGGGRRDRFLRGAEPVDWARSGTDSYFTVLELGDGVRLSLSALAEVMDDSAVEAFLHGYVRLLEAHRDPEADLRLSDAAALFGYAPPTAPRTAPPAGDPVGPETATGTGAGAVLAAVVGEVNELPEVDLGLPYTVAGGRLLRGPLVVAELRRRGWAGLGLDGLSGIRSLAGLARDLVRVADAPEGTAVGHRNAAVPAAAGAAVRTGTGTGDRGRRT